MNIKKLFMAALLVATVLPASAEDYSKLNIYSPAGSSASFLEQMQSANRAVAEEVLPVVVSIDVASTIRTPNPMNGNSPFGAFEFFFRNRTQPEEKSQNDEPEYIEQKQYGAGSGILVKKQRNTYYVLTNNHVVGSADEILVTLYDGREYDAKLVGTDERKDVALVEFDTKDDLPLAELGDSSAVLPGDIVYAVGNPLGFESTFTSGIVSATGRRGGPATASGTSFTDYIQTDAPINQGNSGGALVNIYGQVIGINSWIASQSGGSIGIGFAIPINNVKTAIDQFIRDGKVEYGWLGISIADPSDENRKELKIEDMEGSFVHNVYLNSPAAKAGIIPGDYITWIEGNAIKNSDELVQLVAGLNPGNSYKFDFIREGKAESVNVRITARDEEAKIQQNSANLFPGMTVEAITSEIRDQLDLGRFSGNVIVGYVWEDSPAGKAGLRSGDIIKEINRSRVRNVNDFYDGLNNSDEKEILMKINRGGTDVLLGIVKE